MTEQLNASTAQARGEEGERIAETEIKAKKKLDPGLVRNLKIIGIAFGIAFLLIILLLVFRGGGNKNKSNGMVDIESISKGTQQIPEGENVSPAMRAAVEQQLKVEKKQAQENGDQIYLPKDILEKSREIPKGEERINLPQVNLTELPPTPPTPLRTPEEDRERARKRSEQIEKQLGVIMLSMDAARTPPARVMFSLNEKKADTSTSLVSPSESQTPSKNNASTPVISQDVLIDGMEIVAGETATAVDTYITTYASARILSGKLNGAFLVGSIKQTEEGLRINYTMMRHADKTYAINAIALDEKTSIDAMSSADVDRRYLQRWVFPVAAAAIGAFATASAQVGSTIATPTGGGAVSAVPPPTDAQARAAGVAAGMGIIQSEVAKQASKPFQIKLAERTAIGIMFLGPVAKK